MRTTENETAIEIIGLDKWFGSFHVLRDIDLKVMRGERVVICGPSGSRQIDVDPLHQPSRGLAARPGHRRRHGADRGSQKIDEVRREVGMVFQQFNLFPHLTVLDNCTLAPIWVRKLPKREAEEVATHYLERVRIPEQADKYPAQLSGGQQQRVAIARALCMQPENHAVRRADLGARSGDGQGGARHHGRPRLDGMTMLVVSHEMGFARQVANRMVLMDAGQIVEINEPEAFFNHPRHERTKLFLSQILH